MSGMEYDEAAAERLEAVYLGPDVVAQRNDTLGRLSITYGESILDIGSGPGFLATSLAEATGPSGKVVGVDISMQMIDRAASKPTQPWLSYQVADAADLPFDSESFDEWDDHRPIATFVSVNVNDGKVSNIIDKQTGFSKSRCKSSR